MVDSDSVSVFELTAFLEKMDEVLIDPLGKRSYFESYDSLSRKFLNAGKLFFSRNEAGLLVGLAVMYADSIHYDLAFETYIGVLPGYSGSGIGRALMAKELDYCRSIGMRGFMTNCHRDNLIKMALNKAMGLEQITDPDELAKLISMNPKWAGKVFFKIEF